MNRETIYAALFDLISGLPGIVTASRRLQHWDRVSPAQQPALFQIQKKETPAQKRGLPAAWTLECDLVLYVNAGADPNAVPASALNPLIDAIDQAIAPPSGQEVQTLSGLVSHCWIDKSGIVTDEGVLGAQAIAIVPVQILVP